MSPPLQLIYMGTAEIACPSLQALAADPRFQVLAVVTQPDKPSGRHLKPHASPVKDLALLENLPVLQPQRVREPEAVSALRELRPDLIVATAYGQILPQSVLDLPRHGCVNVHASLLPKYRGAAPIQWALLNGEAETGVTIMQMNAGMDTGPMLAQQRTSIGPDDTAQTLQDRLGRMGAQLLLETIPGYVAGVILPQAQPAKGAVHAPKIKKEDGRLDWTQPARCLWNRIRAFTPWPGAFTLLPGQPHPHLLKIWRGDVLEQSGPAGHVLSFGKGALVIACGEGALRIQELQLEGGRRLPTADFLAGHPLPPGVNLG